MAPSFRWDSNDMVYRSYTPRQIWYTFKPCIFAVKSGMKKIVFHFLDLASSHTTSPLGKRNITIIICNALKIICGSFPFWCGSVSDYAPIWNLTPIHLPFDAGNKWLGANDVSDGPLSLCVCVCWCLNLIRVVGAQRTRLMWLLALDAFDMWYAPGPGVIKMFKDRRTPTMMNPSAGARAQRLCPEEDGLLFFSSCH